ncbi:hypothetical protein [Teredinibacter turnerae]|uniref:hypothetical protein n=1 Tax=Teredinibacter turnerae TaxID=2426 RepID=UPI000367E31E|nr:hypothetical protein [Teredinibacter turnerae]
MRTSFNWPFSQNHLHIDGPETETYARWCFENFSPMAKEVLHETTWFFVIKRHSWLNPAIAKLFAYHIQQMQARLHIAIENGSLRAKLPPNLKINDHAEIIGAVICELLEVRDLDPSEVCNLDEVERHKQRGTVAAQRKIA